MALTFTYLNLTENKHQNYIRIKSFVVVHLWYEEYNSVPDTPF